ncbi:MAG: hypothetical protein ACRCUY_07950 [Thermoguttaceae bacterium]
MIRIPHLLLLILLTLLSCGVAAAQQSDTGTKTTGTENAGTENTGTENTGTETTGTENTGMKIWFERQDGKFVNPEFYQFKPNEIVYVHVEAAVPTFMVIYQTFPESEKAAHVYPVAQFPIGYQALTPGKATKLPVLFQLEKTENTENIAIVAALPNWDKITQSGESQEVADISSPAILAQFKAAIDWSNATKATITTANATTANVPSDKSNQVSISEKVDDVALSVVIENGVGQKHISLKKVKEKQSKPEPSNVKPQKPREQDPPPPPRCNCGCVPGKCVGVSRDVCWCLESCRCRTKQETPPPPPCNCGCVEGKCVGVSRDVCSCPESCKCRTKQETPKEPEKTDPPKTPKPPKTKTKKEDTPKTESKKNSTKPFVKLQLASPNRLLAEAVTMAEFGAENGAQSMQSEWEKYANDIRMLKNFQGIAWDSPFIFVLFNNPEGLLASLPISDINTFGFQQGVTSGPILGPWITNIRQDGVIDIVFPFGFSFFGKQINNQFLLATAEELLRLVLKDTDVIKSEWNDCTTSLTIDLEEACAAGYGEFIESILEQLLFGIDEDRFTELDDVGGVLDDVYSYTQRIERFEINDETAFNLFDNPTEKFESSKQFLRKSMEKWVSLERKLSKNPSATKWLIEREQERVKNLRMTVARLKLEYKEVTQNFSLSVESTLKELEKNERELKSCTEKLAKYQSILQGSGNIPDEDPAWFPTLRINKDKLELSILHARLLMSYSKEKEAEFTEYENRIIEQEKALKNLIAQKSKSKPLTLLLKEIKIISAGHDFDLKTFDVKGFLSITPQKSGVLDKLFARRKQGQTIFYGFQGTPDETVLFFNFAQLLTKEDVALIMPVFRMFFDGARNYTLKNDESINSDFACQSLDTLQKVFETTMNQGRIDVCSAVDSQGTMLFGCEVADTKPLQMAEESIFNASAIEMQRLLEWQSKPGNTPTEGVVAIRSILDKTLKRHAKEVAGYKISTLQIPLVDYYRVEYDEDEVNRLPELLKNTNWGLCWGIKEDHSIVIAAGIDFEHTEAVFLKALESTTQSTPQQRTLLQVSLKPFGSLIRKLDAFDGVFAQRRLEKRLVNDATIRALANIYETSGEDARITLTEEYLDDHVDFKLHLPGEWFKQTLRGLTGLEKMKFY